MEKPAQYLVRVLLEDVYEYSSTQINLPDPLNSWMAKWGRMNIPDEDLWYDKDGGCGRETEPHITVLYGILDRKPSPDLLAILRRTKPFTIRLGKVSLFEQEDHDVVKFEVISEDLVNLSNAVRTACPNENKYPNYTPHCTCAYVKKGTAVHLAGAYPFATDPPIPNEFEAAELVFSGAGDDENPDRLRQILSFNRYRSEGRASDFIKAARPAFMFTQPARIDRLGLGTQFRVAYLGGDVVLTKVEPRGQWCIARGRSGDEYYFSNHEIVVPADWTDEMVSSWQGGVQESSAKDFIKKVYVSTISQEDRDSCVRKSIKWPQPFAVVPIGSSFLYNGAICFRYDSDNWGWQVMRPQGRYVPIRDDEIVEPVTPDTHVLLRA